ncbi:hypothetical protein ABZX72_34245 [Streptomyces cyaneofuscatus]|uniref:hypothetical protein n=1 Tax=Streptomyces cyaneofuscatus TaxID=66883 RepID=UPI0033AECB2A
MSDLACGISTALGDAAEEFDVEAIAAALRQRGVQHVDEVAEEEFWAVVQEHALSKAQLAEGAETLSALERFKAEIREAVQTPAGVTALWTRGGVTLEIDGFSRVSMALPQPIAAYRLTVAGSDDPVFLRGQEVSSWERLWTLVESRLDVWTAQVSERRGAYDRALAAKAAAREALVQAEAAADRARRALAEIAPGGADGEQRETMSRDEVAAYLGIAPVSVSKRMSRWNIDAVPERRGQRGQARYPAAEVQAKAAARPGRGARTDLR